MSSPREKPAGRRLRRLEFNEIILQLGIEKREPTDIAADLYALSASLFKNMDLSDLKNTKLEDLIQPATVAYNNLTHAVVRSILINTNAKAVKSTTEKWIRVMDECLRSGDFHTLSAIYLALNSSTLSKVKAASIEKLSDKAKETYKRISDTVFSQPIIAESIYKKSADTQVVIPHIATYTNAFEMLKVYEGKIRDNAEDIASIERIESVIKSVKPEDIKKIVDAKDRETREKLLTNLDAPREKLELISKFIDKYKTELSEDEDINYEFKNLIKSLAYDADIAKEKIKKIHGQIDDLKKMQDKISKRMYSDILLNKPVLNSLVNKLDMNLLLRSELLAAKHINSYFNRLDLFKDYYENNKDTKDTASILKASLSRKIIKVLKSNKLSYAQKYRQIEDIKNTNDLDMNSKLRAKNKFVDAFSDLKNALAALKMVEEKFKADNAGEFRKQKEMPQTTEKIPKLQFQKPKVRIQYASLRPKSTRRLTSPRTQSKSQAASPLKLSPRSDGSPSPASGGSPRKGSTTGHHAEGVALANRNKKIDDMNTPRKDTSPEKTRPELTRRSPKFFDSEELQALAERIRSENSPPKKLNNSGDTLFKRDTREKRRRTDKPQHRTATPPRKK